MAKLHELLQIRPGVTALMGSGGKTSLLYTLAGELSRKGSVIVATTTHIRLPEQFPLATTAQELSAAQQEAAIVCVGTPAEGGKLTVPDFDGWRNAADYVLVEADGSRGMPLKAHADYEPVIPAGCENVICVVGASGFDKPIALVVHRPERFMALAGVESVQKPATPQMVAQVIEKEHLCSRIFINQTDVLPRSFGAAKLKEFANNVSVPVISGSLRQGMWQKIKT